MRDVPAAAAGRTGPDRGREGLPPVVLQARLPCAVEARACGRREWQGIL